MKARETTSQIWENITAGKYFSMWFNKLLCRIFRHKTHAILRAYKLPKKKNKEQMYAPYLIYFCRRCNKKFGTARIKTRLTKPMLVNFINEYKDPKLFRDLTRTYIKHITPPK